jgi:RNA polymerase sigma-70 factor (ECF subfamily)
MFTSNALMNETKKLQKFSMKLTRNKPDADDLLQATCLRALEKMHYFEEGTNLFSWTSRMMYNLFVSDYRRKVKLEVRYDPESYLENLSVAATQEHHVELANVDRAMMKLNEKHREIIVLICIKEMRYEDVSEKLQIPVGTVRSRLFRAREQLQIMMNTPTVAREISANENIPIIPAYIAAQADCAISMR